MYAKILPKLIILLALLLNPSLTRAQEEKSTVIGFSLGYSVAWRNLGNLGFNIKGNFQYKFSNHWGIQPEINYYYSKNKSFFLPYINITYTFNNYKKYNFFPFLSFGIGGWAEPKEEFAIILTKIQTGIKFYVIKNSEWGTALNFGISSIHSLLLYPCWFDAQIGLELCIFD